MKTTQTKNPIMLGIISRDLADLIKMGFVSELIDDDGNQYCKLIGFCGNSGLKYGEEKLD